MNKWILGVTFLLALAGCKNNPYGKGMVLYRTHCADCHGLDGLGLEALIPPLRKSDYLMSHQEQLACMLQNGLKDTITVNGKIYDFQKMPPNKRLDDISITNIINFINNAWGNKKEYVQIKEVRQALKKCQ